MLSVVMLNVVMLSVVAPLRVSKKEKKINKNNNRLLDVSLSAKGGTPTSSGDIFMSSSEMNRDQ